MFSPISILNKKNNLKPIKVETKKEEHNGNFIEINIYKLNNNFAYGYKIKILKTIRVKVPRQSDYKYTTIQDCLYSARQEIKKKCSYDKKTQKLFIEKFPLIAYNQLELF